MRGLTYTYNYEMKWEYIIQGIGYSESNDSPNYLAYWLWVDTFCRDCRKARPQVNVMVTSDWCVVFFILYQEQMLTSNEINIYFKADKRLFLYPFAIWQKLRQRKYIKMDFVE